jgi:hypothetical protein
VTGRLRRWAGALLLLTTSWTSLAQAQVAGPLPTPLPLFPADHWWNTDISTAPVDQNSAAFIAFIDNNTNGGRRLRQDWGGAGDGPGLTYGIPYVSVPGSQPRVPVTFVAYGSESDAGAPGDPPGYPIPEEAKSQIGWIEGGPPGSIDASGDRHLLIVDRDRRQLFELYRAHWNTALSRWEAESGAVYDLTRSDRRPDGWTSADAAGLAILPGLARYDEVFGTEPITHALRVTVRQTANYYVFPASHRAGSNPAAPPMGMRLRLKASVDISGYPPHMQRLFQAMKTYGLIVADNGSDLYVSGTHDPRWEPHMSGILQSMRTIRASDFEVVQLGWQPPPLVDADGDGLPDEWETAMGLDPTSASGDHGAQGDPDGDGLTNEQEHTGQTHPRGFHRLYFAEGARVETFATRFALVQPNGAGSTARALLRYVTGAGAVYATPVQVPAAARRTVSAADVAGLQGQGFATTIESDVPLVADRLVTWGVGGFGSHAERAVAAPSTSWYFAEGATHSGFQLFYLLQNPGSEPAEVTLTYLRPAPRLPLTRVHAVPPGGRQTIWVNYDEVDPSTPPGGTDSSVVVTSTHPIVAERAMYTAGPRAFEAGHGAAGVVSPSATWLFAEGATGAWFDMFLLLANPSPSDATVTLTYLLPDGPAPPKTRTVRAASRETVWVDQEVLDDGRSLADVAVSVRVDADVPILAERAMWWPGSYATWHEAHAGAGAAAACARWVVAEGEWSASVETYALVANTSTQDVVLRVTAYREAGAPLVALLPAPAGARTNVNVPSLFPSLSGQRFGLAIEPADGQPEVPLVVEWALYADAGGQRWAAGATALGTCAPS